MNITGLKIPTGGRQTSWLFTSMTEELNWGPLRNNSKLVVRAGLEPATSGFQVRRPNHSATLPPCVQLFRFFRCSVALAVMTARQTNNSLAAALSSIKVSAAPVSSAASSGMSSVASSQPGESVVVSLPLVNPMVSANPLPTASPAVLSPELVSIINQVVQAAVQASQRQPEPAIAGPPSSSGVTSPSSS